MQGIATVPEDVRTAVRNNGGGHYNHSMFWQIMSPKGGGQPNGKVGDAINSLGGFDKFKEAFANAGVTRFRYSATDANARYLPSTVTIAFLDYDATSHEGWRDANDRPSSFLRHAPSSRRPWSRSNYSRLHCLT